MDSAQHLPPTPRALSDEELQEVLDKAKAEGGGILAAMQILEAQTQLRELDKSELRAWQSQQLASEEETATGLDEIAFELPAPVVPAPVVPAVLVENQVEETKAPQPDIEVVVSTKRGAKDPSSSQFWVWLTISGSLLPFGIAMWLQSLGLTYTQAAVAAILGMLASAGVVAVGAIAGKRSSLPTLVLSRAAFGVVGNLAPATVLVLSRLFWALVLVALGYLLIAQSFTSSAAVVASETPVSWTALSILVVIVIGSVVLSAAGGAKLVWAQRISGVLGVISSVVIAVSRLSSSVGESAGTVGEGSWLRALGASVVVFAFFGLAWSSASADYASGLPVRVRGWQVSGWSLLSMGVVPIALTLLGLSAFGSLASKDFAASFAAISVGSNWSGAAILVQVSLLATLVTTTAMSLRSSSKSFESIQLKFNVAIATPIIAFLCLVAAVLGLSRLGAAGFWFNLNGYALFLAVPVAAWSGVFVSDVLIRRIAYHEVSLSRSYGFYKSVNFTNLLGWTIAVTLGWGLLRSELVEFKWLGYFSNYASNGQFWAQSNFGVVIAFAIGLLLPVAAGIPRIKRQEAEVLIIESRRNDLKDVLGLVD